jgi:hypothetical protein
MDGREPPQRKQCKVGVIMGLETGKSCRLNTE